MIFSVVGLMILIIPPLLDVGKTQDSGTDNGGLWWPLLLMFFGLALLYHLGGSLQGWWNSVYQGVRPGNFADYPRLKQCLAERQHLSNSMPKGMVARLFGKKSFLVPHDAQDLFSRLSSIKSVFAFMFCWLVVTAMLLPKDDPGTQNPFPIVTIFILLAFCLVKGLSLWVCLLLLGVNRPQASGHQESRFYRAFGHPTHLFERLPGLGEILNKGNIGNRVFVKRGEEAGGVIADVGTFTGTIYIEQEPQEENNCFANPVALMLYAGIMLFLLALISLHGVLVGGQVRPGFAVLGLYLLFNGHQFMQHAMFLGGIAEYRSLLLIIDLAGEMSRANVSIGRGQHDSIGSDNLTVRSNFNAKLMCAEFVSQSPPGDRRRILSFQQTQESELWIKHFLSSIESLREERVAPVGLEMSQEAEEILAANHMMASGRKEYLPSSTAQPMPSLTFPAHSGHPGENDKECPMCAELIKLKALKCRFCGHLIEAV